MMNNAARLAAERKSTMFVVFLKFDHVRKMSSKAVKLSFSASARLPCNDSDIQPERMSIIITGGDRIEKSFPVFFLIKKRHSFQPAIQQVQVMIYFLLRFLIMLDMFFS